MADWVVSATSTETFGRVILGARSHHIVVDGPVRNGCLGEAITPAELFLGGVASCAAELIQVVARDGDVALDGVSAEIEGTIDRDHVLRDDLTLFSSVVVRIVLRGIASKDAEQLVAGFQGRCPLYGTLAAATPNLEVSWTVE